ncbi:hypothetical protein [Georgenia satyanarayanai]|uniref:hypothetical protein n=1 Tax=Georgenia satyanarayanai TaxID=860221 RepID=UPI001263F38A|nr:hypothetical protein [Georgenia satyanarayanai]
MSKQHAPMRVSTTIYLPLRPERGGRLSLENVRRARWNLTEGSTVRLSIYGLGSWEAGVPELIGRRLAESGVTAVEVQASTSPRTLAAFEQAILSASEAYWESIAQATASGKYATAGDLP